MITVGPLVFDTHDRTVHLARRRLQLSRRELGLLEALIRRSGRHVSAGVLKRWGIDKAGMAEDNPGLTVISMGVLTWKGATAEEALGKAGLLDAAKPKFVLGESVAQATQYAATDSVEAALIPQSLAVSPEIAPKLKVALIPTDSHKPIRQKAAILKNAGPVARAFYAFLKTLAATATFERHGFSVPK